MLFDAVRKRSLSDVRDLTWAAFFLPGTATGGPIPTSVGSAVGQEITDDLLELLK